MSNIIQFPTHTRYNHNNYSLSQINVTIEDMCISNYLDDWHYTIEKAQQDFTLNKTKDKLDMLYSQVERNPELQDFINASLDRLIKLSK